MNNDPVDEYEDTETVGLGEDDQDEQVEWPERDALTPERDESILSDLRNTRQNIKKRRNQTTKIPVPGYDNKLVVEYKALDWTRLRDIGVETEKSTHPKKELVAHAKTIAEACVCIYARSPRSGKLVPLSEVMGVDFPITYGTGIDYFHQNFNFPKKPQTARDVVYYLFDDELSISDHHGSLLQWMQNTNRETDEAFAGE